jgi:hypothetical protein
MTPTGVSHIRSFWSISVFSDPTRKIYPDLSDPRIQDFTTSLLVYDPPALVLLPILHLS